MRSGCGCESAAVEGGRQMSVHAQYRVTGMDCAKDAAEIEAAARAVRGVESVKVSTATHVMSLESNEAASAMANVEVAVTRLDYQLDRIGNEKGSDSDMPRPTSSHVTPAYRRAMWTVVVLNVGYGVIEMFGGFLSDSQALKADALDFLGDGLITLLGLMAIDWSLHWRARSALMQGLFLGALGLSVLVATAYRTIVQQQPEAELMGIYGLIALVVNVAAALVLIPHRTGDANVRAVWLFSRNDAIGNAAVIVAAGLVAWTGNPWPDLAVAGVIAALFLHSSLRIVRDARGGAARRCHVAVTHARRILAERPPIPGSLSSQPGCREGER